MFPDQTTDVLFSSEQILRLENELFKSGLKLAAEPREIVNHYRKRIFFRDTAAGESAPFLNIDGKEVPFRKGITRLLEDSNSRFLSYDSKTSRLQAELDAIEKRRQEGRSLSGDIDRQVRIKTLLSDQKQAEEEQRPKVDHSEKIKQLNDGLKQATEARDVAKMISLKNRLAELTLKPQL